MPILAAGTAPTLVHTKDNHSNSPCGLKTKSQGEYKPLFMVMIKLVPFIQDDFHRLVEWINSLELLVQWTGPYAFTFPLDMSQAEKYLRKGQGQNPKSRIYKAVDLDDKVVGHIELATINCQNGTAIICRIFVAPDQRRKGICTQMLRAILYKGFIELELRRIELWVYAHNIGAIQCYEKIGFVKEGFLRKYQKIGDKYWDMVIMSILKYEWASMINDYTA